MVTVAPVHAKDLCGSREMVVSHLGDAYGEKPTVMALASSGGIIQVLVASDGTWTMIITRPSGVTCIVEFGEGWQAVPMRPDERDS